LLTSQKTCAIGHEKDRQRKDGFAFMSHGLGEI
jgi:hypothetical protein